MKKILFGCLFCIGGLTGLLVLAVIFLAVFGGEEEINPATQPEDSVSEQSELSGLGNVVPFGTTANVRNDRTAVVTGLEEAGTITSPWGDTIDGKGGKLVAAYMTLGNTGSESGDLLFTQIKLVDGQGRKYDALQDFGETTTLFAWREAQGLSEPSNQIFPGGTIDTVVVFRVAQDASEYKVEINRKFFSAQ